MKRLFQISLVCLLIIVAAACQLIETPISTYYSIEGIDAGVPSMPYYAYSKTGLQKLNHEMEEADIPVTLADTYSEVYGLDFNNIDPIDLSGEVFLDIKQATLAFQKMLKAKHVQYPEHYILTIIDTARDEGLILFAAVYRPRLLIKVPSRNNPNTMQKLTPEDLDFYIPYQSDSYGILDTVFEWAALPVRTYQRQSHQAVLLTLTANKVLLRKSKKEFWAEEDKWVSGDYISVAKEQDEVYCQFLGIEKGYTEDL